MPRRIETYRRPVLVESRRDYEGMQSRLADKRFYASAAWRRLRAVIIRDEPLCRPCKNANRLVPAEHVHHVLERKDRPDLAFDASNLEPVCRRCHNEKRRGS